MSSLVAQPARAAGEFAVGGDLLVVRLPVMRIFELRDGLPALPEDGLTTQ